MAGLPNIDDIAGGGSGRALVNQILQDALGAPPEQVGQLEAEIEQGIGEKALEVGGKGIGHLGDILDMPGAFIRGIVGSGLSLARGDFGRAGERFVSAFPGSEELPKMLGLGEGLRAPTGSDLLKDVGVDTGLTMDEERRIRIAQEAGMSRAEAKRMFTTRYEEESLSPEMRQQFHTIMQQALQVNPDLKTGITTEDIERATTASDFAGFAAEVLLDPLTYFTFGASAAGKAARATKSIKNMAKVLAGPGEKGAKAADRVMTILKSADSLEHAKAAVKAVPGREADKANLLNVLEDAWKNGKPDLELGETLLERIERGQFRAGFKLPGGDPAFTEGATKAIQLVGNGIAAIGEGAMRFRPVADFVARHPGVQRWPTRLWLRLSGEARKADVLGNDKLTELYLHEQYFNRTAGAESLKYAAELKRETARILNGLTEAERAEVMKKVPSLIESPSYRGFAREQKDMLDGSTEAVNEALLDYADLIRASDDEQLEMMNRWGLGVAELAEDFDHLGRQFSDELMDFFARRPDARKAWLGRKTRVEKQGMQQALLDVEKGRKLRGMGFHEAEDFMREVLEKYNLPDDIPIWEPDPTRLLLKRNEQALEAAKIRNLAHVAAEVYSVEPIAGAQNIARQVVREATEASRASASKRAAVANELLADAKRVQAEFRQSRKALKSAERKGRTTAEKAHIEAMERLGMDDAANVLRESAKLARQAGDSKAPPGKGLLPESKKGLKEAAIRDVVRDARLNVSALLVDMKGPLVSQGRKITQKAAQALNEAKSINDVRNVLRGLIGDMRKVAPKAQVRKAERMAKRLDEQAELLDEALGAVSGDVAKAVNAKVSKAEQQAKVAQEMLSKTDVSKWSAEAKAQYVLRALKDAGLTPEPGQMTALELMMKTKVRLSDNMEDLAALGARFLDDADGKEFTKYASTHYWQHLNSRTKIGIIYDAIKGVYQRSTLARVSSLARDLIGTTSQGLLAGNHRHLEEARKALGNLKEWADGTAKVADDVHFLRAAGVLRTTKGEALEGMGALRGTPFLGKVEESGVVGGSLRAVGAEKTGKAVGEKLGTLNDARIYWEEVNRVATYRKAIAEGMSQDDAIAEVYKYWGSFAELSKLERTVFNRIFFFWSWMARSVPTSLRTMLHHPVKARFMLTALAGNVANSESAPEWMRRMGGWMLGQDEDGNYTTINLGNSTYFSPTMSALQSDMIKEATHGNFGRAAGEAMREVARSAPPFVTAPYERMTETETFTNENWWQDPHNRVGSNLKAPAGYYWLEGTALGDLLGVKVVSEETSTGAKIKQVYMDPEVANFLSAVPGLEPLQTDISAFADPRKQTSPGPTLGKGLLRTAGVPAYEVEVPNEIKQQAREWRRALAESIDELPGHPLATNGVNVYPNSKTQRGREIKLAIQNLSKNPAIKGQSADYKRAWIYEKLSAVYPQEARWLILGAKLRKMEELSEPEDEKPLRIR